MTNTMTTRQHYDDAARYHATRRCRPTKTLYRYAEHYVAKHDVDERTMPTRDARCSLSTADACRVRDASLPLFTSRADEQHLPRVHYASPRHCLAIIGAT